MVSKLNNIALLMSLFLCSNSIIYGQSVIVDQDDRLEILMKMKEKLEKNNDLFSGYTIQIYNGSLDQAKEERRSYIKLKKKWASSVQYETPNYKLWIGNFDSRLEADKALLELKNTFPAAFVLKPERK